MGLEYYNQDVMVFHTCFLLLIILTITNPCMNISGKDILNTWSKSHLYNVHIITTGMGKCKCSGARMGLTISYEKQITWTKILCLYKLRKMPFKIDLDGIFQSFFNVQPSKCKWNPEPSSSITVKTKTLLICIKQKFFKIKVYGSQTQCHSGLMRFCTIFDPQNVVETSSVLSTNNKTMCLRI